MGNLLKNKEKYIYHLIHALLLVCIALFGAGSFVGIGNRKSPTFCAPFLL